MACGLAALLGACDPTDTGTVPSDTTCADLNERLGFSACLQAIRTRGEWESVSTDARVVDQLNGVKFLVPVSEAEPLPTMFVNSEHWELHYDFLREAFPADYGSLSWEEYVAMIIEPARRAYFGGNVAEYIEVDGTNRFGFIVWDDPADPTSAPTYDEVLSTWRTLQAAFGLGELMFVPSSSTQREAAAGWTDAPFHIRGDDTITYEAYTPTAGFGTLRFLALADLEAASLAGEFSYTDILVLDEAPMDLERVVSGIVTGTRQGGLSHLNVRMSARGTPNCYSAEPYTKLAAWEGQLVRLECAESQLLVEAASQDDADAWWADLRPDPVDIAAADTSSLDVPALVDAPSATEEERSTGFRRYGAKGQNLATLYQRIDPAYTFDGVLIPFAYYQRFMEGNAWEAEVEGGSETLSFAETLLRWHAEPAFLSDSALRNTRLTALREAMAAAPVDPADLAVLHSAIEAEYASTSRMVRLRSSSNAEDGVVFSGAGLYDSVSACLADSLDSDESGPSLCDDDKSKEKPLDDALRAVWASLWNAGAWEERDWYGIDHTAASMAVLVNDQTENELANIVAFTGNPLGSDDRWLIEAQLGDLDVVSAEPGIWPERLLVTVSAGEVLDIERESTSSEVVGDQVVLTDAQIDELVALLWVVEAEMPYDADPPASGTLMWDTELKVLDSGQLIIKQVRPYLRD